MGVKSLQRTLNAWIKRRGRMTKRQWLIIRKHMKESENEIIQRITFTPMNMFQLANLQNILSSVNETITKFDVAFKTELENSMRLLARRSSVAANLNAKMADLIPAPLTIGPDEIVNSLWPISQGITSFFTGDMRNIINAEVTLGIASGDSTANVAKAIKDKYGLDTTQRAILNKRKEWLDENLRRGNISKTFYNKEIKKVSTKLASGSQMSYARAERISTTEMLRATSFTEHQVATDIARINPDAVKIWINAHMPGARPGHLEAETKYQANPIPVDAEFMVRPGGKSRVGFEPALFPRAFTLSAANVVWCHCTSVTVNKNLIGDLRGLEVGI